MKKIPTKISIPKLQLKTLMLPNWSVFLSKKDGRISRPRKDICLNSNKNNILRN